VLGGGVAANKNIRQTLEKEIKNDFSDVDFRLPELSITGDNAIMIAEAALLHLVRGNWKLDTPPPPDFRAVGNLSIAS
jgi:tRNA A37 threonylcarbamoyltransferase TsaD